MGSVAAARGSGVAFSWRGRSYRIGVLEWNSVITELQTWLEKKAIAIRMVGWMALVQNGLRSTDWLEEKLESFMDECTNVGRYSFGSPAMMSVLGAMDKGDLTESRDESAKIDPATFGAKLKLMTLLITDSETRRPVTEDELIVMMDEIPNEIGTGVALAMKRSLPDDPNDEGDAPPQNQTGTPVYSITF